MGKKIHTAGLFECRIINHHFFLIYESFLRFSHPVSIQLAFSKFKPDVGLEFNEAHWKTSE